MRLWGLTKAFLDGRPSESEIPIACANSAACRSRPICRVGAPGSSSSRTPAPRRRSFGMCPRRHAARRRRRRAAGGSFICSRMSASNFARRVHTLIKVQQATLDTLQERSGVRHRRQAEAAQPRSRGNGACRTASSPTCCISTRCRCVRAALDAIASGRRFPARISASPDQYGGPLWPNARRQNDFT